MKNICEQELLLKLNQGAINYCSGPDDPPPDPPIPPDPPEEG